MRVLLPRPKFFVSDSYNCSSNVPLKENVDFLITVVTADVRGNGTDGDVFITMIGEKGESEEQQLTASGDSSSLFERNSTDKFTVTTTDVGALQSIRLRMSAPWWSSVHSDWYLQEVQVLSNITGLKGIFSYNNWVVKDATLTLGASSFEQIFHDYQISVVGQQDTIINQGYASRIK